MGRAVEQETLGVDVLLSSLRLQAPPVLKLPENPAVNGSRWLLGLQVVSVGWHDNLSVFAFVFHPGEVLVDEVAEVFPPIVLYKLLGVFVREEFLLWGPRALMRRALGRALGGVFAPSALLDQGINMEGVAWTLALRKS